jgi:hypothetical protein
MATGRRVNLRRCEGHRFLKLRHGGDAEVRQVRDLSRFDPGFFEPIAARRLQ